MVILTDHLKTLLRTSLVVQWLGLRASTARGTGLIPGQELRFHMLRGVAKKKKKIV